MAEMKESSSEYVFGDKYCWFSTAIQKEINKMYRLKEKYPDEVDIRAENMDGSIYCRLPASWYRAPQPPKRLSQTHLDAMQSARGKMLSKND